MTRQLVASTFHLDHFCITMGIVLWFCGVVCAALKNKFTQVKDHAFIRGRFSGLGKNSALLGWLVSRSTSTLFYWSLRNPLFRLFHRMLTDRRKINHSSPCVFFVSHGANGNVFGSFDLYSNWFTLMVLCPLLNHCCVECILVSCSFWIFSKHFSSNFMDLWPNQTIPLFD